MIFFKPFLFNFSKLCYHYFMFIRVNGVELYYEMKGEGRPLIMLHGNREDHSIFDSAAEVLKKHYRIILLDSRCHGQSEDAKELNYNLLSDDLICFVQELGLDRPIVFGFSDGAIATLYAAAKLPKLFSSIIVAGANSHPKGLKRYVYRGLKLKVLFSRDKYDYLMLNGPMLKKSDLERITIPTLVLAGENDVVKAKDTKFIAASIPNSKLLILPDEDHGSYIVHSRKIADIILGEDL